MTTKLANILYCYAMGMGIKVISTSFELSRNTVRKYVRLFQKSGIPMEQLLSMPASRIQEIFGGSCEREHTPRGRQLELEALLPAYAARPTRKGVTVKSLFEEYRRKHPGGFRHASFGLYIHRFIDKDFGISKKQSNFEQKWMQNKPSQIRQEWQRKFGANS